MKLTKDRCLMSRFNERIWTGTLGKTRAASVEGTSWSLDSLPRVLSSGLPHSPERQSKRQSLRSMRTMFLFESSITLYHTLSFWRGFSYGNRILLFGASVDLFL